MSRLFVGLVFGLLVLGFVFVSSEEGMIPVIVIEKYNVDNGMRSYGVSHAELGVSKVKHRYSSINGFSGEVSEEEFRALERNSNVMVFRDKTYYANLDVSVPNIGADDAWDLEVGSMNLTGKGTSVCVIDTGVNYSHPAFGGCYGDNNASSSCVVIGGHDFVNDDSDPMDDYGHGSHVAGIVASRDSTYSGVSPGVKIVAIKALDDTGSGSSGNVIAGIDWCIDNASEFNISVISMSLGDCSNHSTYCNGDSLAPWIDAAAALNISVVVSAGNGNSVSCSGITDTAGPSSPACVESAIAVGRVNDADVIDLQRGPLFELLAPGLSIMSVDYLGGFRNDGGTSMSAPHVSGAIAILNQVRRLQGDSKLRVSEIKNVLNNTGTRIDDMSGSGYNFSRIEVYDAVLSLDSVAPEVFIVSPVNNHINLSVNQSFVCNATDWQLLDVTLRVWDSDGDLYSESSFNFSGISNESSFDVLNMSKGEYSWNCFASDEEGNLGSASVNFSLTIGEIEVELNSPEDGSVTNVNESNFNCTSFSVEIYDLVNVTFEIWNSSMMVFNETRNVSGVENETVFNYTFLDEGVYEWACVAYNNNSDRGNGINYSVEYDVTAPVISSVGIDAGTSSASVSWTSDVEANSSIFVSGGSWSNSSSYTTSHSISVSSLSASTSYDYIVYSCDVAGNCGSSSGDFVTDAASSSGGGGGGSSSTPVVKVIDVAADEFWKGKSGLLSVNDKMNFNLASGNHGLEVLEVGVSYAKVVVESDPVYLTLDVGEEVKLNLSSEDYCDLAVKLNNVSGEEANVSVRRIFEMVEVEEELNESEEVVEDDRIFRVTDDDMMFDLRWVAVGVALIVFWIFVRSKEKEEDVKKFSRKELREKRKAHGKRVKKKDKEFRKKLKGLGLGA